MIPETVQVINKYAFDSCPNLKNVALSEGLLRIEEYAFLRNVSEITIPKSVTYIAWHNFWSIQKIYLLDPSGWKDLTFGSTIPEDEASDPVLMAAYMRGEKFAGGHKFNGIYK